MGALFASVIIIGGACICMALQEYVDNQERKQKYGRFERMGLYTRG